MNLFEIKCACGGFIFGPREGGKARGRWLGYDACAKCRAQAIETQRKEPADGR